MWCVIKQIPDEHPVFLQHVRTLSCEFMRDESVQWPGLPKHDTNLKGDQANNVCIYVGAFTNWEILQLYWWVCCPYWQLV